MGVPMLAADRVVGVIVLWRTGVEPFDDRTIGVVAAFAAQGAVAIQNVQLLHELQERSGELSRSVEELRALGEVSRAVSSSLDLDQVLTTIVTRAVELSNTDGGSIFELEPSTRSFKLRTCFGTSDELDRALQEIEIPLGETFVGRAAVAGEVLQAADLAAEPPDPHVAELLRHGWRSMVAVPLRHEDDIVGALVSGAAGTGFRPRRTPSRCSRRSRASPPWRSTTRASSASCSARARSWRSPAATSRSSWRACRTSSARR